MTYETSPWRQRLHTVVFEADTPAGRAFDVAVIACILASIGAVILESVPAINARGHRELFAAELVFTALFTVEYALRLMAVRRPLAYVNDYVTTLGVMNSDGSGLTPLISAVTWTTSSWSPDGQRIAFTSGSEDARDISWVKADGSAKGLIVRDGWNPSWSR